MASQVRTVDFLPEIFQTETNRQFLKATLDQLVQEPKFKKTQGFIGRRVGPGVNPNDRYVVEPTEIRTDYQLEPAVVLKEVDTPNVDDIITYPGINDALKLQGAYVDNADRLYTSEYYSWDPFVDFDKFANFAEYYWLPGGPDNVDVFAVAPSFEQTIDVTRTANGYSFSNEGGTNPDLILIRGGSYTFNIAQNQTETINYRVTNDVNSSFVINYQPNPTLTLVRGNTYTFTLSLNQPYKFYIKTEQTLGTTNIYNTGVTNNGSATGTVTFTVPYDAPDTLYYINDIEFNLKGQINVVDATPGNGPKFWVQSAPGVNGVLPWSPNISSRDVLGVTNNGIDLGTLSFAVPTSTAQSFYYNLTQINPVNLVTNLKFDQINNQPFLQFLETYGGIDGITSIDNLTLIFGTPYTDGWDFNALPAGFDEDPFGYSEPVTDPAIQYGLWQIHLVDIDGVQYIQLQSLQTVDTFNKFTISFGTQYSSTGWYKNSEGTFEQIPLLTAIQSSLYYQDSKNPALVGEIRLVDQAQAATLDVLDIIDRKNYTSPNGVVFTNGLKVTFTGNVVPASYAGNTYYVEGVGTAIKLVSVESFVTPEPYTQSATAPFDPLYIDEVVTNPNFNPLLPISPSNPTTITTRSPATNANNGLIGSYDTTNFDATLNAPEIQDYLTINRASPDLNPWTRSNRWFHIDVINASAAYNDQTPIIDNTQRARRPILEFRAGTKLFNFGTEGKQPVDIIDFTETDALSNINGQTGYGYDGYQFINGTRVIFAADVNPDVRNKIYVVDFISPDTVVPVIQQPIIDLVPAADADVVIDDTVVCLSGDTLQGQSFWFDGVDWKSAQQKTKNNQAPLFDVYDLDGYSFSNVVKYPSSTFVGSKLFSYATPTTGEVTAITNSQLDPVLGFQLTYLSLTNIGDIVFDNNLYKDTFGYVPNNVGTTLPISNGVVRQYSNRITFTSELGWQTAVTKSRSRQQFQFTYNGTPLMLDVAVIPNGEVPSVQVFITNPVSGSVFLESGNYTVDVYESTTMITLIPSVDTVYSLGSVIEINVLSDQISPTAFYQVPVNLENNPLNANSTQFTLGTIRNHYGTICQNLLGLVGPANGANNTRDLGNLVPYGEQILQQSSPLTLAGYFMRSQEYDIFASLNYNSREYIKFKSQLLETVISNDYGTMTIPEILDSAIAEITFGRTELNPFYWSDMLPTGSVFTTSNTTITAITTNVFNTSQTYDFTSANYLGLLVYILRNQTGADPETILLERGIDYVVSTDSPVLTIDSTLLQIGDIVSICEYADTAGNFVPNTPTKMGLYPKFLPKIFLDTNYVDPTFVIQGHDGSLTVAFDDFRDDILLEFEKRIYNNLKTDGNPIPLTADEVIPGYFRTTDYSQDEITSILGESFLSWVGWNKVDYKIQNYVATNPFTYNYSQAGNKLDQEPLLGAWRGIYRYFYDTASPNLTPWEMLGFSEEPTWWQDRYGPAPYTSDNLVLWDDLAAGYVADPVVPYVDPLYVRPDLTKVIPVDSEGQLLSPLGSVVGPYDPTGFQKSWNVGDGGPVEYSWWTSSSYPFAIMRLLALTRPAEFFSLFADRDVYRYRADFGQYLYNHRYRLDANGVEVYGLQSDGTGVSKASYINWIVDYNQTLGLNSTMSLTTALKNLDVRLAYRMASFSDPQYLEIYVEKSSPNSQNSSLLLPPESYNLELYKNQPFSNITYSALIVEQVEDGYAVFGYSTLDPYFNIVVSSPNGILQTVEGGGAIVRVPKQYTTNIAQIPYGFTFSNRTMVVDFILSYGAYLESQGLVFVDQENGHTLNWMQMATEFLYFSQQGWTPGTLISLNPVATTLTAVRAGAVVDTIISATPDNLLIDQNRQTLDTRNLIVNREGNTFSVTTTNNQTISYLNLKFTSYEHIIVLDNVSIFNDLIYDPTTAARQSRVKLIASTSIEWNGELNAPGFILNQNNVKAWAPYKKYTKGEIVLYKNLYWQAAGIIQPKDEFAYDDWVQSNYQEIQTGLLPNIPNKANQLANTYNINQANLEKDNDLLAYGLIGFRPRQYMSALNLDNTTQVNLYSQFLGTKGTIRAAELFTRADLGKESGEYNIYENWAVLAATYGANANKSFFELQLNEAYLQADPSIIQVIEVGETSAADQTVLVKDIWRTSTPLTGPNILPVTYENSVETALPTAGYVNLDDVDITVFSLDDPTNIAVNFDIIGVGTTIWIAKVNSYDWGIYRCATNPGRLFQLQDNLNGTSIGQFTTPHNLVVGDLIIIKYFNGNVDGVYRVLGVPNPNSIIIAFSFINTNQTSVTGTGIVYDLQTMRVNQASNVATLDYVNNLIPGAKAWVDNDGTGHWKVLQKTQPFTERQTLLPYVSSPNSEFGFSVTQGQDNFSALVGAPNDNSGVGAVYAFGRNSNNLYSPIIKISLPATDVAQYGHDVSYGSLQWSVAGAPGSLSDSGYVTTLYLPEITSGYEIRQLLVNPEQDFGPSRFGDSVVISRNERWMYLGAPISNSVYAYTLVDIPAQVVAYTADGVTTTFNWSDYIQIDPTQVDQLLVAVENTEQSSISDFYLSGTNIVFYNPPNPDLVITISRRQAKAYTYTSGPAVFQMAPYLYTVDNIYSFTVRYNGTMLRPHIDYEWNDDSTSTTQDLTLNFAPAVGSETVVTARSYWQYVDRLPMPTGPDSSIVEDAARFGYSVSTSNDGGTVVVGTPYDTVNGVDRAGSVYVYDRSAINTMITDTSVTTYAISGLFTEPISVALNGQYLTNSNYYLDGQYTVVGSNVVLNSTVELTIGDTLTIETNQFQLVQTIVAKTLNEKAGFGYAVNICDTGCSIYTGSPFASTTVPQDGLAQRNLNQSRVYGIISSQIGNPTLTAGQQLRVNDYLVTVPNAPYNTVAGLAETINASNIPNVTATPTSNLTFIGDNLTKAYYIGPLYTAATSYTTEVYVNDQLQTLGADYTYNPVTEVINFVVAPSFRAVILVVSGRITITVKNLAASTPYRRLLVLPATSGTVFEDLGFELYPWTQTIVSPNPSDFAQFGASLHVDTGSTNLVVGAPNGNTIEPVIFDDGETYFDDRSTTFITPRINSGVVYTYDLLPSANESITNPGLFAFGQQIYASNIERDDQFGTAVDYTAGRLIVGMPGANLGANTISGEASVFINADGLPAWQTIHAQQPTVDVYELNTVFAYDKLTSKTTSYFDFFNPLQGKILGAARRNIDYIGAVDPAAYNQGAVHNYGNSWADEHLGEMWWDTDTVRFIDPNQDNETYASRRWGQTFPGSRVDIYQWVESSVPPANYVGSGIPLSNISYTATTKLGLDGILQTRYYFWVRGITSIQQGAGKTLSAVGVASYIENPRGSGIPYIAALNSSTIAIYNAINLISAQDTILHIGYDQELTSSNIHQEYQFIADGRDDSFLNDILYRKLQDSLCGSDSAGANVPDPNLNPAERYGVQFRPRQSMFADRFTALQNYLSRANRVLAQYPIVEIRSFDLLNSSEPIPTPVTATATSCSISGNTLTVGGTLTGIFKVGMTVIGTNIPAFTTIIAQLSDTTFTISRVLNLSSTLVVTGTIGYNKAVVNLEELGYQNINIVPLGYLYLVVTDSSEDGLWTIYEVNVEVLDGVSTGQRVLELQRIQNYKTNLYWRHINWYLPGYNSSIQPLAQVPNYSALSTVSTSVVPLGGTAKVTANGQGKFEIYQRTGLEPATGWTRVALEDGTIAFNEELWNYAAGNFGFDVEVFDSQYFDQEPVIETRKIIQAINEQLFIDDLLIERNQCLILLFNFVYSEFTAPEWLVKTSLIDVDHKIRALKPFQIYQQDNQTFVLDYIQEVKPYHVQIREFNLAYYGEDVYPGSVSDFDVPAYYNQSLVVPQYTSPVLTPYSYPDTLTPVNTVSDAAPDAQIWLLSPWKEWFANYATNASLIRSIKTTIKYDRCEYTSNVVDWVANTTYNPGDLVRYAATVWAADQSNNTQIFEPQYWTLVPAGALNAANRTQGYYLPGADEPGRSLPLLIDGLTYPGVQVMALSYNQNTGFDVGNYDINPFDNIAYGPEGLPTYDPALLDAIYSSSYLDIYLGTRPTDINVDGGAYVDAYSSHAPEELVPGIEFDTLDLRVYTRPGSDWTTGGYGYIDQTISYVFDSTNPTLSFDLSATPYPMALIVSNQSFDQDLDQDVNYTVDWVAKTITIIDGVVDGQTVTINVYEPGGGNQLYKNSYNGADIVDTIVVPVQFDEIQEIAIWVNGTLNSNYTYEQVGTVTVVSFNPPDFTDADYIMLLVLGPTTTSTGNIDYSWSAPQTQYFTGDGLSTNFDLINSLIYTNPDNLVVTVDGIRKFTSAGVEYLADGSTDYLIPARLLVSQDLVSPTDVYVYVNNVAQVRNIDWVLEAYNPAQYDGVRVVTFINPATIPSAGENIQIYCRADATVQVFGTQLVFNIAPISGASIAVTTWNDVRQQNLLTKAWVGPVTIGTTISEAYDTTLYDNPPGVASADPGLFDFTTGSTITSNDLQLGRVITDPNRLWVSLNGERLFPGDGFVIADEEIVLTLGILGPTDIVQVTMVTNEVVPQAMAFRIFQDMRGVQATYRITPATTTALRLPLAQADNIAYVIDATALAEPNFAANVWGVFTVNGERVMYRYRDLATNTVSGLLRGTAGTAAADHDTGNIVYDLSRNNLMPQQFQNYVDSDTFMGDGSTTFFTAVNVSIASSDSTIDATAVEVYVGGTLAVLNVDYTIQGDAPVEVEFIQAPADGVNVTILVRRGVTWYAPGAGTPSDGIALQLQPTQAARFLRGL